MIPDWLELFFCHLDNWKKPNIQGHFCVSFHKFPGAVNKSAMSWESWVNLDKEEHAVGVLHGKKNIDLIISAPLEDTIGWDISKTQVLKESSSETAWSSVCFSVSLSSVSLFWCYFTQQIQTKYIIVHWALSNPGVGGWRHHCIFTSTWPSLLHDKMSNVDVSWWAERWINGLQRKSRRLREVQVHTLSLTSILSMYSNVLSGLS